jgi:hypothetical protein
MFYPKSIVNNLILSFFQVLDLRESELEMVCDHLGHNVAVHRNVYRSQSQMLLKTIIARLLISMENGTINQFQGRRIEDIQLDGMLNCYTLILFS